MIPTLIIAALVTCYSPSPKAITRWNFNPTVQTAACPKSWKLRTIKVQDKIYQCQDTGLWDYSREGKPHIDIVIWPKSECIKFGRKHLEITVEKSNLLSN